MNSYNCAKKKKKKLKKQKYERVDSPWNFSSVVLIRKCCILKMSGRGIFYFSFLSCSSEEIWKSVMRSCWRFTAHWPTRWSQVNESAITSSIKVLPVFTSDLFMCSLQALWFLFTSGENLANVLSFLIIQQVRFLYEKS